MTTNRPWRLRYYPARWGAPAMLRIGPALLHLDLARRLWAWAEKQPPIAWDGGPVDGTRAL